MTTGRFDGLFAEADNIFNRPVVAADLSVEGFFYYDHKLTGELERQMRNFRRLTLVERDKAIAAYRKRQSESPKPERVEVISYCDPRNGDVRMATSTDVARWLVERDVAKQDANQLRTALLDVESRLTRNTNPYDASTRAIARAAIDSAGTQDLDNDTSVASLRARLEAQREHLLTLARLTKDNGDPNIRRVARAALAGVRTEACVSDASPEGSNVRFTRCALGLEQLAELRAVFTEPGIQGLLDSYEAAVGLLARTSKFTGALRHNTACVCDGCCANAALGVDIATFLGSHPVPKPPMLVLDVGDEEDIMSGGYCDVCGGDGLDVRPICSGCEVHMASDYAQRVQALVEQVDALPFEAKRGELLRCRVVMHEHPRASGSEVEPDDTAASAREDETPRAK